MFIPTSPAEIPSREIDVHKELLDTFEQLTFDFFVMMQVIVGSLMFIGLTHCSLLLLLVRDASQ